MEKKHGKDEKIKQGSNKNIYEDGKNKPKKHEKRRPIVSYMHKIH